MVARTDRWRETALWGLTRKRPSFDAALHTHDLQWDAGFSIFENSQPSTCFRFPPRRTVLVRRLGHVVRAPPRVDLRRQGGSVRPRKQFHCSFFAAVTYSSVRPATMCACAPWLPRTNRGAQISYSAVNGIAAASSLGARGITGWQDPNIGYYMLYISTGACVCGLTRAPRVRADA